MSNIYTGGIQKFIIIIMKMIKNGEKLLVIKF